MLKLFFVSYIKYPIFPLMFPLWLVLVLSLFRFFYSYTLMNKKVWGYICIQSSAPSHWLGEGYWLFWVNHLSAWPLSLNLLVFNMFVLTQDIERTMTPTDRAAVPVVSVAITSVIRNDGFMSDRNITKQYNFLSWF